jgi:hypothetical protein
MKDRRVLNLLGQYLRRTAERGGSFWDYEKGISLGCPENLHRTGHHTFPAIRLFDFGGTRFPARWRTPKL